MNNWNALLSGCLFTTTLSLLTVSHSAEPSKEVKRPNIVFILADDLGYGDVHCTGRERCQIATPGFDALAREGILFTDAHANASVCVPTRTAIMTGIYPWRLGLPQPGGPWGYLGPRFPRSQHTLGQLLKDADYATGYVGKWHLGTRMQTTDGEEQGPENVDFLKPLTLGPMDFGFDESFILPGSLDMFPYVFAKNNRWQGNVGSRKGWSAFNRVGPAADDFEDTQVLDTFAVQAEQFIASQAAADSPFFLFLALTAPHTPVSPSQKFQGKSKLGIYGDFVMETDHCVQRILDALEHHQLADSTLVIATSDHGAASYAGPKRQATPGQIKELEKLGHYSSGIYRGYKFSVYEGGTRVPFVARWPGVIAPNSRCDQLVALQDIMRTIADITGVPLEDNQAVDSISFLPLLKDPASPPTRTSMLLQANLANAIRFGKWKLALCPGSGCQGHYGNTPPATDAWTAARRAFGRAPKSSDELAQAPFVQLFDLKADPAESHNVAANHPERVRELLEIFKQDVQRGRSTTGRPLKNAQPDLKAFRFVPKSIWN